jgi:hypothetical protein
MNSVTDPLVSWVVVLLNDMNIIWYGNRFFTNPVSLLATVVILLLQISETVHERRKEDRIVTTTHTDNPYRFTKTWWRPENFRRAYFNLTTRSTKRNCIGIETKAYYINIYCFSDFHAAVRCKRNDWFTRNNLLCPSEATCRSVHC